jgi:hypothetical protein
MKTAANLIRDDVTYLVPTETQVTHLQVGDKALDCFGKLRTVVAITARGTDVNGRHYVCFYVSFGHGSQVSGSYKVGELVRTVETSREHTSAELDAIEEYMQSVPPCYERNEHGTPYCLCCGAEVTVETANWTPDPDLAADDYCIDCARKTEDGRDGYPLR